MPRKRRTRPSAADGERSWYQLRRWWLRHRQLVTRCRSICRRENVAGVTQQGETAQTRPCDCCTLVPPTTTHAPTRPLRRARLISGAPDRGQCCRPASQNLTPTFGARSYSPTDHPSMSTDKVKNRLTEPAVPGHARYRPAHRTLRSSGPGSTGPVPSPARQRQARRNGPAPTPPDQYRRPAAPSLRPLPEH